MSESLVENTLNCWSFDLIGDKKKFVNKSIFQDFLKIGDIRN